MLHGWGQTHRNLQPLAELLAPYARTHLLDLPGFGASSPPPEDWDTTRYAECVVRYLDAQGLNQVDLLGHSFGGRISLRIAAQHPDRVRKLVLLASHGLKVQKSPAARARMLMISRLARCVKWLDGVSGKHLFETWFTPRFGSADYRTAGRLRGTLVKVVTEDQSPDVPRITAPTLLLWGDRDQDAPLQIGQRLAAMIKDSQLIVLPHRGHYVHDEISAHLCAFYIKRFLGAGAL